MSDHMPIESGVLFPEDYTHIVLGQQCEARSKEMRLYILRWPISSENLITPKLAMNLTSPHPREEGSIIPILQAEKLRHREIK